MLDLHYQLSAAAPDLNCLYFSRQSPAYTLDNHHGPSATLECKMYDKL